jgi:hypothetical protein
MFLFIFRDLHYEHYSPELPNNKAPNLILASYPSENVLLPNSFQTKADTYVTDNTMSPSQLALRSEKLF